MMKEGKMGGFLYFLHGTQHADDAALKAVGLDRLLGGRGTNVSAMTTGPDGGSGVMLSIDIAPRKNPRHRSKGDEQVWKKSLNGLYWIGLDKDAIPGPEDLERPLLLEGHLTELGDKNKWVIPIARQFFPGEALPYALVLGDKGEWVHEALPEYVQFSKMGERLWIEVRDSDTGGIDESGTIDMALEALGLNYHIGPDEVSMLKLMVGKTSLPRILGAIIDMPTLELARKYNEKKKAEEATKDASGIDSESIEDGETE